jgi:nucleoside-diphosphate-sugar epimerase
VLITGCGDVGLRLIRQLRGHAAAPRIVATARRAEQRAAIRAAGALALPVDLDRRDRSGHRGLMRLAGLGRRLVHLAPPATTDEDDLRTRRLLAALAQPTAQAGARHWVYVSTTGVYGDCAGAWIDETRPLEPQTDRAQRRVAAEGQFRTAARRRTAISAILRAPGIYAADRLPVDRLRAGMPALREEDDVWTNHIHAEDLARACWIALFRGRPGRSYNIVDQGEQKMGAYFDEVADALGLERPPRLPRHELARRVSPMMLSFMNESRRIRNYRMTKELRLRLRFPTVSHQLALLNSRASLV